ncbi:MAG: cytochrome C [Alphaproteobacteria bacterium]|nr:cytochrome C [Alphaproteobacteria bacterium]
MRFAVAAALALGAAAANAAPPELKGLPELTTPQSDYVEHCSGCHGMQGNSAPAEIPVLRDRVGYFMCTREGRDYLIRLPNVAYSAIGDNQQLADMMNFVVFGLGGNSAPKGAKPFTASEVARLRTRALATQSLIAIRADVVSKLGTACAVPDSINFFYDGQQQAAR